MNLYILFLGTVLTPELMIMETLLNEFVAFEPGNLYIPKFKCKVGGALLTTE